MLSTVVSSCRTGRCEPGVLKAVSPLGFSSDRMVPTGRQG
ncbi:hypothetical protein MINT15_35960 [Saccharomonospora viridis]|uniref:Uncharacterized protein n=1 Tax=Saccharomonospora viridis TaxID=1852 RepID=A0A837DAH7_9PSEU|nr:hypothetical protein MINT15_35960 [Saccharomonospora viridis]